MTTISLINKNMKTYMRYYSPLLHTFYSLKIMLFKKKKKTHTHTHIETYSQPMLLLVF